MKKLFVFLLIALSFAASAQFNVVEVGLPPEFNGFLDQYSGSVSTRSITCRERSNVTFRRGKFTIHRTVRFSLGQRVSASATQVATNSALVSIASEKMALQPLEPLTNGFKVAIPAWFVPHALNYQPNAEVFPSGQIAMQQSGGFETTWTYRTASSPATKFTVSRPTQYEFFLTNPFPATWSLAQIDSAIEDGVSGSCLWVIKWGALGLQFAVTPERVLRDVRSNAIVTVEDVYQSCRQEVTYITQPSDRIQNIFPRLSIVGNKLVNTTIINGRPWQQSQGVRSSSGQAVTWSWFIALHNDCPPSLSTSTGPAIYNIGRCSWIPFSWNDASEFTLVASTTEPSRIDVPSKTIYYHPDRRVAFSIQMRQANTDKGEDYDGWTTFGFYSHDLAYFLSQTFLKPVQ